MQELWPRPLWLTERGNNLTGFRNCARKDVPHCGLAPLSHGVLALGDEAFNIEHSDVPHDY